MKKRVLSLLVVLAMAIGMGASLAAVPEAANVPEISTMSAMQTMSAETLMAFKGKFTDFFPDQQFAEVVSACFNRAATDEVTLFELIGITALDIAANPGSSLSTEGIGYLMGLEKITISRKYEYGNYAEAYIHLAEDIANCGNLKKVEIYTECNWSEALLESGVDEIGIYTGHSDIFDGIPDSYVEKMDRGELLLYIYNDFWVLNPDTGEMEIPYTKGEPFDLSKHIPPVILKALEKGTTSLVLHRNGRGFELLQGESFNDFIVRMNAELYDELQLDSKYPEFIFGFLTNYPNGGWSQVMLHIDVKEAPLTKPVNASTTTMDGRYSVAISGEVKGHFADGVTSLDAATIATQPLTFTVTDTASGTIQTYGPEMLSSLAVTVSGQAIQSVTMFAMVNGSSMLYVG